MLRATVEDIMTETVVKLHDKATIGQAAHVLLRFRINGVVIVRKGRKNDVVGIVTTTDLLRLLNYVMSRRGHRMNQLEKVAALPVGEVCSKAILGVQKDTKLERLIALMHRKNVHTIPVFDGDKVIGVVGRHDILNAAFG
ncbi:MAG: CBS domain-containing protein [Candidatus Omnitrophota bacterium]